MAGGAALIADGRAIVATLSATGRTETSGSFDAVIRRRQPRPIARQNARGLKVTSTSWCRIPLPPLTSPRSRMMQYVPLLMRANFAP
ncbi:hypothetical protein CQ14_28195 [Bradyrhizobium lablabi]|uniref:Uncharacterized protein n=1 Tax=Bradyrhizobium lablabi TaxID=722472 RepID=A0A0R3M5A5_9BRAD|nr:hypothetical protein CQ14_28195 [Bradyrhizobium lablabi]